MSVSGAVSEIVAERWVERTLAAYPAEILPFLSGEHDRFRNPVGQVIQESLTTLARELLGAMDNRATAPAIDALVRMRAVQDFSPSAALRFIFDLRPVIAEVCGEVTPQLESRIDELALMAFDRYLACREQIASLREKELRVRALSPAR
ncbi:dissimilatory sulfite reductase system component, protein DsrT [Candidatus Sulfotelmatomonas gaucii]|uniref:Dissimilatory sulfite reductase system component, protein DsrT n=1 Tax=Candidatus Sulfuritelmatomonas gaucii TaxID=2043161 RepID=A0A2N9M613_9BACT|nr:dissimilatory sulfite reductase system component, protein DsrT [Candidatus Sulfotelmatomonas gaucii]